MLIKSSPLNNNYKPKFEGKIIDAHVHCGEWTNDVFKCSDVLALTRKKFNSGKDYIERVIISNLDCIKTGKDSKPLKDELVGNLLLLMESKNNKKLIPLAVCQPGYGSAENIEYLVSSFPQVFKGLKFHPACLNLAANDSKYIPYMKVAEKYNLPCLFHSEVLFDNTGKIIRGGVSEPDFIYETAKQFPNTPVILGHMGLGGPKAHEIGIETLINSIENGDARLYADLAWVDWADPAKPHIVDAVRKLSSTSKGDKTERLLFGTDAPLGVFGEKLLKQENAYNDNIVNIKKVIRENFGDDAEKFISRIFYRNSNKLFNGGINKSV